MDGLSLTSSNGMYLEAAGSLFSENDWNMGSSPGRVFLRGRCRLRPLAPPGRLELPPVVLPVERE